MSQNKSVSLGEIFRLHDERFRPFVLSKADERSRTRAVMYLCDKIANPHEGSDFDRSIGKLRHLLSPKNKSRYLVADYMLSIGNSLLGYDAMMLEDKQRIDDPDGQIVGYTGFQVHGIKYLTERSLHVFSIELLEEYFGQRLGAYMNLKVIEQALTYGIERIRIGKGVNPHAERTIDTLLSGQADFSIILQRNDAGWLRAAYK